MKKIIEGFDRLLEAVAVLSLATMMVLVASDAFSRYALNRPLPWASEFTTHYLMAIGIYFMIGMTLQHGDHINIDFFRPRIPRRLLGLTDILWSVLAAAVFAGIAYGSLRNVVAAYSGNEFMPGYFRWPAWLSHLPILIGSIGLVLRLIFNSMSIATGMDEVYAVTSTPLDIQE